MIQTLRWFEPWWVECNVNWWHGTCFTLKQLEYSGGNPLSVLDFTCLTAERLSRFLHVFTWLEWMVQVQVNTFEALPSESTPKWCADVNLQEVKVKILQDESSLFLHVFTATVSFSHFTFHCATFALVSNLLLTVSLHLNLYQEFSVKLIIKERQTKSVEHTYHLCLLWRLLHCLELM